MTPPPPTKHSSSSAKFRPHPLCFSAAVSDPLPEVTIDSSSDSTDEGSSSSSVASNSSPTTPRSLPFSLSFNWTSLRDSRLSGVHDQCHRKSLSSSRPSILAARNRCFPQFISIGILSLCSVAFYIRSSCPFETHLSLHLSRLVCHIFDR